MIPCEQNILFISSSSKGHIYVFLNNLSKIGLFFFVNETSILVFAELAIFHSI